jgi:hypothetical protein
VPRRVPPTPYHAPLALLAPSHVRFAGRVVNALVLEGAPKYLGTTQVDAGAVRLKLGRPAWLVWRALCEARARFDGEDGVVGVCARRIARTTGLTPKRVKTALARLRAARLVLPVGWRAPGWARRGVYFRLVLGWAPSARAVTMSVPNGTLGWLSNAQTWGWGGARSGAGRPRKEPVKKNQEDRPPHIQGDHELREKRDLRLFSRRDSSNLSGAPVRRAEGSRVGRESERARWTALLIATIPTVTTPPPPNPPADEPVNDAARRLGKMCAGVLECTYGKAGRSWPLRHPTPQTLAVLTKAVLLLREYEVPVVSFLRWQLHVWDAVTKGKKPKPPPLGWLLAEKRILAALDIEFERDAAVATWTPTAREFATGLRLARIQRRWGSDADTLEELEDLLAIARRDTAREQARIARDIEEGRWIWRTA